MGDNSFPIRDSRVADPLGIGFVLIVWAVFGSVAAVFGSLILRTLVNRLTRRRGEFNKDLLRFAFALPFLCLSWAAIVFVLQGVINVTVFHRDIGLGDGFECPLPNGYALSFIDTTEIGTLHKSSTDAGLQDVRFLQMADPYIVAASDSKAFDHFGQQTTAVDTYYLIDERSGRQTRFGDMASLREAARQLHFTINLLPIDSFYSKYRFTWFDAVAAILLIIPPLLAVLFLGLWTFKVRRWPRRIDSLH